jgi:hypothetical protein
MKVVDSISVALAVVVATASYTTPIKAETPEKAAFQSLKIEMSGMWIGQHSLVIQGDGNYTFDLNERRKDFKDHHAAYRLKSEHLRRVEELLKATNWLTMSPGNMMVTDVTTYKLTLGREGHKTTIVCEHAQEIAYKELIRVIDQIDRQEKLLYEATMPDRRSFIAHEVKAEIDALAGKPDNMPYAPIMDYHRLVPVFSEWLAKPQGLSYEIIGAAAELMAFLKIESQRSNLEAIALGHAPNDPEYKVRNEASIAAVKALGRLGGAPSLGVLKSLQAHEDPFVRDAVAEALVSVPPTQAMPILKKMTTDSRCAAWALIQLGDKAESAIIDILLGEEANLRNPGFINIIREYYEHWKELPAPPSAAIVQAIHDRVQVQGGLDQYGRDVLKYAGDPFVERNARQDLQATFSLMATKGQEMRKKLLLRRIFGSNDVPEGFIKNAEGGNLLIRRIVADRTSAFAHVADKNGETNYVIGLGRDGFVWIIGYGWAVSPEIVQTRMDKFIKDHPEAKEIGADVALP